MYTHTKSNKKYIGLTKYTLEKRAGKEGCNYKGCPRFYDAIQQFGMSAFKAEVVKSELTRKEAADLEKKMIRKLKTRDRSLGYNLQPGGFCYRRTKSSERRRRQRIKTTLRKQRSSSKVRKTMSNRMKDVWSDPIFREKQLNILQTSPTGKPKKRLQCRETGEVYSSQAEAAKVWGLSKSYISRSLKEKDFVRVNKSCGDYVHLYRY